SQQETLAGLAGGLTSLPSYGDRVSAMQQGPAAIQQRLGGLDELRAALRDLGPRPAGPAAAGPGPSAESQGQLLERLAAIDRTIAGLAQRMVDGGAAGAPGTSPDLGRLNARFDQLESHLAEIARGLRASGTEGWAAVGERLSALQEDVTAIGSDVAGLVESSSDSEGPRAAPDRSEQLAVVVGKLDRI